jgi:hypothetical protein
MPATASPAGLPTSYSPTTPAPPAHSPASPAPLLPPTVSPVPSATSTLPTSALAAHLHAHSALLCLTVSLVCLALLSTALLPTASHVCLALHTTQTAYNAHHRNATNAIHTSL